MPHYDYDKDYPFAAFITNLGKYNEGSLVGEWVKFPTTAEELKKVFERIAIDPTKIETELGWEPKYNFDSGIQQTIQWYLDNQEWWKNILSGEYSGYFDKMYGNRL